MSEAAAKLPEGLLLSWYGDDFTGSAAVMEVLALAGLPSVLFFEPPTAELVAKFSGYRGIGIAGVARSQGPQWMARHLPPIFAALAAWKAPITHYKICSTLDSAPHVGSIGKAIELAEPFFRARWVPLLVAAPAIRRYQLFGNLFVTADGVGYRLDRHPTMSRHPVTPMNEADVRCHLARQTSASIGLVDHVALNRGAGEAHLNAELMAGRRIVAIDVLDDRSLIEAGRLIWSQREAGLFAVGSQGLEYALAAYWREAGLIEPPGSPPRGDAVDRIAIVSGSCSEVTARQIDWAQAHGYAAIRLDVRAVFEPRGWSHALEQATASALTALDRGRDPIVFTARGPDDPAVAAFSSVLEYAGADVNEVNARIGMGLGRILDAVFRKTGIRRGVLAGGDTSGHGARVLGIQALTLLAPTVPGAALFRAHSDDPGYAHLEIALKGGQMGATDYFAQIKNGGASAA